MQGPSWCHLCRKEEESAKHLFLKCDFALEVWGRTFKVLNINLVTPKIWSETFITWYQKYPRKFINKPLMKQV